MQRRADADNYDDRCFASMFNSSRWLGEPSVDLSSLARLRANEVMSSAKSEMGVVIELDTIFLHNNACLMMRVSGRACRHSLLEEKMVGENF
jgi:hypothetical protein